MPLISILMPVWNAAETLRAAVRSIQSQSFREWELVAVNDGSTDASLEILDQAAQKDRRIRVLTGAHAGHVEALRSAARMANAPLPQPVEEVVVLGPAGVPVAARPLEEAPPHEHRRVRERALDEEVGRDLLVREQPVLPLDVGPHPLGRPPHQPHARRDDVHVRRRVDPRGLQDQPSRVHHVVRVHPRQERRVRPPGGRAERLDVARVSARQDPDPPVFLRRLVQDLERAVRRPVVHRHELPLAEALALHRTERGAQGPGGVPDRHEDGDERHSGRV